MIWNLSHRNDKQWVRWVHSYYVKNRLVWDTDQPLTSWLLRKFFNCKKYFEAAGISYEKYMELKDFSIKKMYRQLVARELPYIYIEKVS